jgi:hypothetical protein
MSSKIDALRQSEYCTSMQLPQISPQTLQEAKRLSALTGAPESVIAPMLAQLQFGKEKTVKGPLGQLRIHLDLQGNPAHHSFVPTSGGGAASSSQNPGQDEIQRARGLASYFGKRYRYVIMENEAGRAVLHTANLTTKEVARANEEHLRAEMREHIGTDLGLSDANAVVQRAFDHMRTNPDYFIDETGIAPLLLSDQEPERWCYQRLAFGSEPLHVAPKCFQDLLSRVAVTGAADSVVLWIGSLLDPEADRSQCLTFHGAGRNGKSSLLTALRSVLKASAVGMEASELKDKFAKSKLAGRRLAVFDDNNNTGFMSSGDFKRITGNPYLRVEHKGKDTYETRNHVKMIVAMNRALTLTGDDADLRRSLFVRVGQADVAELDGGKGQAWEAAMKDAGKDIVRYCYTRYRAHKEATGSSLIPVPKECLDEVFENSALADARDFIRHHLVWPGVGDAPEDFMLAPADLLELLRAHKVEAHLAAAIRQEVQSRWPVKRADRDSPRFHRGVRKLLMV